MSKTACASCSTTEVSATIALGGAALAFDPLAPAAAPKTVLALLFALIALALIVPDIWRRRRASMSLPLMMWLLAVGWQQTSLLYTPAEGSVAPAPFVVTLGLALALARLPRATVRRLGSRVAMIVGAGSSLLVLRYAHGGHGNPNWLGLAVVAALPLVVDRVARVEGVERWLGGAAVILSLIALWQSGSRSAWIGGGVAAIYGFRSRRRPLFLIAVVLGVVVVWRTDAIAALEGRWWIWRAALSAYGSAPITGHGCGGFAFAFLDAQGGALQGLSLDTAAVRFVNARSAHADWLHLLVEGGPFLSGCVALSLGAATVALSTRWRGASAMLIALIVAGLGDVPLQQPAISILLAFAFASCPRRASHRFDRVLAVVVVASLGLWLPRCGRAWWAEREMTHALTAPLERRVAVLERAAAISPGRTTFELGLAQLALGEPAGAIVSLERSRKSFANVGTDIALGNARLGVGDADAAIDAFRRALARQPARFAAHVNLAEAARRGGDFDLAERHLRFAAELQPHHPKLESLRERLRRSKIDGATAPP